MRRVALFVVGIMQVSCGTTYADLVDAQTMLRTFIYPKLTREEAMPVDHLISSVIERLNASRIDTTPV